MWTKLDEFEFENDTFFTCDGQNCNIGPLQPPFFHCRTDLGGAMDLCSKCYNNSVSFDNCFTKTVINNKNHTCDEECSLCNKNLDVNYEEWTLYSAGTTSAYVCNVCNKTCPIYDNIKEQFLEITDNIVYHNSIMIDTSPVDHRIIPTGVTITEKHINEWIDCLNSITYMSPDFKTFGSLKQWILFTDLYDIPYTDALTGLLVDCSVGTNGRVASLTMNNERMIGITIIYDTFDLYLEEYGKWLKTKASDDEIKKMVDYMDMMVKISSSLTEYGEEMSNAKFENDDIMTVCKEFSGYIRLNGGTRFYYR
jgi:hypothetical protein